uniref:CSON009958 protein n=1 Tax=Culicoides sonorensis TaxID=179676 RepID=A0A336LKI4_CULSO
MDTQVYDDEPPPEPREGWLLVRIYVPELNVHKCLQFPSDKLVWDVKQQVLASLPKVSQIYVNVKMHSVITITKIIKINKL